MVTTTATATATATALGLWPEGHKSAEETLKTACLSLSLNPNLNPAARLLRWAMRRNERTVNYKNNIQAVAYRATLKYMCVVSMGTVCWGHPVARLPPRSFGGVAAAVRMLRARRCPWCWRVEPPWDTTPNIRLNPLIHTHTHTQPQILARCSGHACHGTEPHSCFLPRESPRKGSTVFPHHQPLWQMTSNPSTGQLGVAPQNQGASALAGCGDYQLRVAGASFSPQNKNWELFA